MDDQTTRGERFRALHEGEPFVIPNPWDAGSARVLEGLGFAALATTSSGFAFTLGRSDGEVTCDELAAHVATLAAVTTLPISVDLENGFGPAPEDAAEAIRRVAAAGAVGGSIEDWDPGGRLYHAGHAADRVAAAAQAARGLGFPFVLTAGADVLYAPGLKTVEEIREVCSAVGRPVNVLARPDLTFAQITGAGAQRVSVGGALAWSGVTAFAAAAEAIRDRGDFSVLGSGAEVARLLAGGG